MSVDPYPELAQFIGCHFHEDYDLFGETIEEIMYDFKRTASTEQIRQVCFERDVFIAEDGADAAAVYAQHWGAFNPAGWGYAIASFFEELKRVLNTP